MSTEVKQIEPGQKFNVTYGNDHQIEVLGPTIRQKQRATRMMGQISACTTPQEVADALDELIEIFRACVGMEKGEEFDKLVDTLDDEMMAQIVRATMSKSSVSVDEGKKSE